MQLDSTTSRRRGKAVPNCNGQQTFKFAEPESTEAPQIFDNPEFGSVRTMSANGSALFCATDVAKALGYARPADAITSHCKGSVIRRPLQTPGGMQEAKFIAQPDVLRLIAHSKLPNAQKFEAWMFEEVMPSVVNHGGYIAGQEQMEPEELLCRALLYCNSKVESLERVVKLKSEQIHDQNKRIDSMAPKAALAEAVIETKDEINVADLSAILQQVPGSSWKGGRNTLHKRLMADGYTRRNRNGDIVPSQKAMKLGVLRVKESHRPASDGGVHTDLTTMVTGKGQAYFVKRYAQVMA